MSGRIVKILVFGNPLVKGDSMPLRMLPELRKAFPGVEFRELDPMEGMEGLGRDLVILDTVRGIKKVRVLEDLDSLEGAKMFSLHDMDLGFHLKLLKKAGMLDSVKIIGVPQGMGKREALEGVKGVLNSTST